MKSGEHRASTRLSEEGGLDLLLAVGTPPMATSC